MLKKALALDPNNPRAHLEMGILSLRLGQNSEATDYFEETLRLAPQGNLGDQARDFLASLKVAPKDRSWEFRMLAGMQYDSNVVLDSGSPQASAISNKSDWRGIITLGGNYALYRSELWDLTLGGGFYQSFHIKLTDYNLTQVLPEAAATVRITPQLSFKAVYSFEYLLLDGNSYDTANSMGAGLSWKSDKGYVTSLDYRFRTVTYINSSLFPTNDERNGSNNLVGLTQKIPFGSTATVRLGYSYDRDNARRDYWSYQGNRVFAGSGIMLPARFVLDLAGEFYNQNYDGISPVGLKVRHDQLFSAGLTCARFITDNIGVVAGFTWYRNMSNIDAYDYTRNITSLLVTVRY
jgi:hypothetical protein